MNFSSYPVTPLSKVPELKDRKQEVEDTENLFPESAAVKSYQDFYRIFYGTQEGVNLLRKKYGPTGLKEARAKFGGVNRDLDDVRMANDHFLRIRNRARCRAPVAQVVRVKDYYPDPSREYLPRCTLLHRCSDTSGCCDSDAFHCVPSAMQEVTLHFYTLAVGKNGLSDSSIEKLLFVNHTACQCQPINDLPRIQQYSPLDGEEPAYKTKCRECPVPFTSRIYKDGRCGCDCFDRQKPCLRIKRGREPLSEIERRCVEANHCHIPDCEYGLYSHRTGYCPKRHDEDQRPTHRRHHQPSSNQRWAFLERD
ncbi:uncharacterized protein LOC118181333 isoform X2 [Stegodyphus dumicola]|uniref:uncharacterized protein LOC118181333 isoform X2 n=1 Tax=Stegodyphus dumicola TaxID=202533 RepID=UPI0015AB7C88|nr:uncharacterized protein LOC118181333 isoform X2 [Stegodyphus dumicola]